MRIIAGYVTVDVEARDAFVEEHRDLITRARQVAAFEVACSRPPF